jgi:hypothetical protein
MTTMSVVAVSDSVSSQLVKLLADNTNASETPVSASLAARQRQGNAPPVRQSVSSAPPLMRQGQGTSPARRVI